MLADRESVSEVLAAKGSVCRLRAQGLGFRVLGFRV